MSEEKKNLPADEVASDATPAKEEKKEKAKKEAAKKPNFFVRTWRKLCKLCKDVAGETKKVVWTPKDELKKSTKLVLVTVVAVGLSIAIVDTVFSILLNTIAGLIG